jgi:hypothetical protein
MDREVGRRRASGEEGQGREDTFLPGDAIEQQLPFEAYICGVTGDGVAVDVEGQGAVWGKADESNRQGILLGNHLGADRGGGPEC